jgi:hypothetical protein
VFGGEIPFSKVEVGSAYSAHPHLDPHLTGSRNGDGALDSLQGRGINRPRHTDRPRGHGLVCHEWLPSCDGLRSRPRGIIEGPTSEPPNPYTLTTMPCGERQCSRGL